MRRDVALVLAVVLGACQIAALASQLTTFEMRRALALARASDTERARFHAPYIFKLTGARLDYVEVEQIEVTTEFRRLELIAEEHARRNDSFGSGGLRDVETALRPWRDRIAVVARLRFQPTMRVITGVPPVTVAIGDAPSVAPLDTRRDAVYSGTGEESFLVGGTIEALFHAASVGTASRPVLVAWNGKEIGCVTIDFGALK